MDRQTGKWMDGPMDRWTDGRTDGRMDGRTDGWTDGWKFTPVSYRTSVLWGRCPKSVTKNNVNFSLFIMFSPARTGLASMSTNETHVKVRATIGVNDLVGSYKAAAKFMNFGPQFTISIGMESVGVAFEVVQVNAKQKPCFCL